MANYRNNPLQDSVVIARALGDPARVRAMAALAGGELCACQIIALLGLAPSTVSRHMAVLRQAGLVAVRKSGRWMHFRRPAADEAPLAVHQALEWLDRSLAGDPAIQADRRQLKVILNTDPEELCRRQCCQ